VHARERLNLKRLWSLLAETARQWSSHNAARLAASLSCYAILSSAPLVIISVALAGWAFGEQAARGQIAEQIGSVVGSEAGRAVEAIVLNARQPGSGVIGTIVGLAVLLFGASGAFAELQSALNTIWGVAPKPGRGVLGLVRDRFFSFGMVVAVAFLLLASLVVSAGLAAAGQLFSAHLPGGATLAMMLNFAVSLGIVTVLFALVFKFVPEAEVHWADVWLGAFMTAILFDVGKLLLGIYVGRSSVASAYGAAGSLVALVIWIYYTSQIVFFGAEFTQVHARRAGRCVRPSANAVVVHGAGVATEPHRTGPPQVPRRSPAE
jgi:membrane protein